MKAIKMTLSVNQRHRAARTARVWRTSGIAGSIVVMAALVSFSGCDAGPEQAPSELVTFFRGTWNIVGLEDARGDRTPTLADFEKLQWKFRSPSGAYELTVVSEAASIDGVITGTWIEGIDSVSPVVVMSSSIPCSIQEKVEPGQCIVKIDLSYAFEFSGDQAPGDESTPPGGPDILTLTTEGETVKWLNAVFGSGMEGVVQLTLKIESKET
jgi:hypothetical protein